MGESKHSPLKVGYLKKKHVFDPEMNIFQRLVGCVVGTVSVVMIANSYIII